MNGLYVCAFYACGFISFKTAKNRARILQQLILTEADFAYTQMDNACAVDAIFYTAGLGFGDAARVAAVNRAGMAGNDPNRKRKCQIVAADPRGKPPPCLAGLTELCQSAGTLATRARKRRRGAD